jgi:hypothetical protein
VSSVARKPLSIAFEEIADHKIVWTEAPEDVVEEFDAEAEEQAIADAADSAAAETGD